MKTSNYSNKFIAVLGAGESGEAAAILLQDLGAMITILDTAEENKLRKRINALGNRGIRVLAGLAVEKDVTKYDLAVLSPGIDPSVPLVQRFLEKRIEMIGELELAYEMCQCPIVAITGTNGKTTTTQLVEQMLNRCGVRTVAAGNIGPAFSARVRQSSQLDLMTLEVSSFQLETIRTFRPHIAAWLNFAPDHLDRYHSVDEYYEAKLRIFQNQTGDDWAVVNLRSTLPELKARRVTFSAYVEGADFSFRDGRILHHGIPVLSMADTELRGAHNAENLMAALGIGLAHGLRFEQMAVALSGYQALPHRCELIRVFEGVEYVNDSKATNLDALEKAIASETRPVVLIAGGKDKGFEFDTVADLVGTHCRTAVLIGEMADRINSVWSHRLPCINAGESLAEAVRIARNIAQPGDVVLLSPGTSSFDMFKSYADRGNQFRTAVESLT